MSLKEAIKTAAKGLDNSRDDDWQEDGRPSLKRIHQLAKTTAIKQEDLDDALPDLKRDKSVNAANIKPTPDAAKADANTAKVAKAPAKLAPAKAPHTATDTDRIKEASGLGEKKKKAADEKFVENVMVTAVEVGYYGSKLREPGESFYYTGRLGKWMEISDADEREAYAMERAASADGDDRDANVDPASASL